MRDSSSMHIGQRGACVQKRHSDVHAAASVSAWLPCASGADAAGAVPNRVARPWLGANPVFRCLVRHRGGLAVQPVPRSAGGHSQPSIPRGKTQACAQVRAHSGFGRARLGRALGRREPRDQEPEPLQVANHQPPRYLIRTNRRWSGWTGRAFIGYRAAKAKTKGLDIRQRVAGTPPTSRILLKDAVCDQILNVSDRRVLGTLRNLCPL